MQQVTQSNNNTPVKQTTSQPLAMPESIGMKQPGFIVVKIETDTPEIAQGDGWQWNTVVSGAGSWTMQVSKYFDDIPTNDWASKVARKAFGKAIKNIEVKRNGTANN